MFGREKMGWTEEIRCVDEKKRKDMEAWMLSGWWVEEGRMGRWTDRFLGGSS